MPRFYLPPDAWPSATLEEEEARHLAQVLRIKPGASVTVFDGCGRAATAIVRTISRDQVTLEMGETMQQTPVRPAITLAQAIPKNKNMDLIVQKAVELGVAEIQPLITSHTIVHPRESKADKWRRIALEACKQCGQNTLPRIQDPLPFDAWIRSTTTPGTGDSLHLIASLAPGAQPMNHILSAHPQITMATVLIGPEGDFTREETAAALAAGYHPVSLGSIVLRVETATLFCLSALRYQYESA